MERIDGEATVDIGGGRRGFVDEDLGIGREGTEVTAKFLNGVQEEMMAVLGGGGLTPDGADNAQMVRAIRRLSGAAYTRLTGDADLTWDMAGRIDIDAPGRISLKLPRVGDVGAVLVFCMRHIGREGTAYVHRAHEGDSIDGAAAIVPIAAQEEVTFIRTDNGWVTRRAAVVRGELPIGTLVPFAGPVCPAYYLIPDGRNVSRGANARLFAAIGTTFGAGDGSTTFTLPDARGRVLACADILFGGASAGRLFNWTPGQAGGAATHALTLDEMAAHSHSGVTSTDGNHFHQSGNEALYNLFGGGSPVANKLSFYHNPAAADVWSYSYANTSTAGAHSHAFYTNTVGASAAHNNVQPTLALNHLIYAGE